MGQGLLIYSQHAAIIDHDLATYARKIKKEDGVIDWSLPAERVLRHVRAMNPWPGASTTLPEGGRLTVLEARAVPDESGPTQAPQEGEPHAGTIVAADKHFLVATGAGLVATGIKLAGSILDQIGPARQDKDKAVRM